MYDEQVADTVGWLESIDGSLAPTVDEGDASVFLDLPRPPGADYFFRLIISGYEYTLAAVPADEPEAEMFWHQSFESLGAESLKAVEPTFRDFVLHIISHDSRITQRRGLLLYGFTCEIRRGDAWKRVGGRILALRRRFRAPRMQERTREYRAPALIPAAPPRESPTA